MVLRSVTQALSVAVFASMLGCPPGHPPGPRGGACDDLADCNDRVCGDLVPCVRGFCLATAVPVRVVCNDAGADASLYECDSFTECNDTECGEDLIACIRQRCDPDAPRLQVPCDPECVDDVECVVALPYDRCCECPTAMSREALLLEPCFYDADVIPASTGPDDCYGDCETCAPQCEGGRPVDASCTGATCRAIPDEFCDEPFSHGVERMTAGEAAAVPPPFGVLVTISGTVFADTSSPCNPEGCNPGPSCTAPITLDTVVEVRGTNCGEPVECSNYVVGPPDTECTDALTCRPLVQGVAYEVTGVWSGTFLDFRSFRPAAL